MRDTEHGGLVNGRMLVDRRFDFCAIHVLPTAQDHVLQTILDVIEAMTVDSADVAAAQPTVADLLGGRLRLVPVPADQHRALEPDLAALADGDLAAIRIA